MDINNVLAHAQEVMLNEGFWKKVDASTPGTVNGAKSREAKMFKDNSNNNIQVLQPVQHNTVSSSKIDKNILESFAEKPSYSGVLNASDYSDQIPASYLHGLNGNSGTQQTNGQEKSIPEFSYTRKGYSLNESAQPQYTPQQSTSVDYEYIKFLINESLKNYFKNESGTIAGVKISSGNKIHFIDSKGNIYEGVLTLKKKKS